jgi:hypothetical protein
MSFPQRVALHLNNQKASSQAAQQTSLSISRLKLGGLK